MKRLDALVGAPRKFRRGEYLYRNGDPFKAIHLVKAGFFKTSALTSDYHEQVTGFQMSGEILGLDGISSEAHTCDAVALEDSQVCLIPFPELEVLASEIPAFQRHFHRLMSREIVRDQGVMMLLGPMRVEERMAAFLLNLSQRLASRGYSPIEFHLRMTRGEIGSYLGLQQETVSRAFSSFQEMGLITVQNRHIRILDIYRLKSVLGQRQGFQWLRPWHIAQPAKASQYDIQEGRRHAGGTVGGCSLGFLHSLQYVANGCGS
jgi:CRP/FNR family transcriptional regulator